MQIEWHKVTWYSKALAVILGLVIFVLGMYIGQQLERNNIYNSQTVQFVDNHCDLKIYAWNTNTKLEREFTNKCDSNDLPAGWSHITKPGEAGTWSTFSSSKGYQFDYPSEFRISDDSVILNQNLDYQGAIGSGLLYNNPDHLTLLDWLVQQGLVVGQRVMTDALKIDNLETVHLFLNGGNGGTQDTFYFVKNDKLYSITLDAESTPDLSAAAGKPLALNNKSKWYNTFLKSFIVLD